MQLETVVAAGFAFSLTASEDIVGSDVRCSFGFDQNIRYHRGWTIVEASIGTRRRRRGLNNTVARNRDVRRELARGTLEGTPARSSGKAHTRFPFGL